MPTLNSVAVAHRVAAGMAGAAANGMEAELTCAVCLDLANDAVETHCCHQVLCYNCSQMLQNCPHCRQPLAISPAHVARRLIGNLPATCEWCSLATTRSELAVHQDTCNKRRYTCPGCASFEASGDKFLKHLISSHRRQLLANHSRIFQQQVSSTNHAAAQESTTRRVPRISYNKKHYCRGRLNGAPCDCCDGSCGPEDGCNCLSCMRLDLAAWQLRPGEGLVNRAGNISKMHNGHFYCGRKTNDILCSLQTGLNCHACSRLDVQVTSAPSAKANSGPNQSAV